MCRKRCRNLISLHPQFSSFACRAPIERRAGDIEFRMLSIAVSASRCPMVSQGTKTPLWYVVKEAAAAQLHTLSSPTRIARRLLLSRHKHLPRDLS